MSSKIEFINERLLLHLVGFLLYQHEVETDNQMCD